MDRDRLWLLLDGFKLSTEDGRSLASVVERDPVAVVGNALVFRVAAGAFLGINSHKSPEELIQYYRGKATHADPIRVSLPTDGVYARAIMDSCVACEEHEGGLDWVLKDEDPELERLAPDILQSRRAEPQGAEPTPFSQPIINLQNAPEAPQPTGLSGVLSAVTTADAFRDMAGLAGTQANAMGALNQAASLATSFGSQAVDLRKAELATEKAEKKLAAVRRAKKDNLINDEQAQRITEQVLTGMNGSSGASGPGQLTREPAVRDAIERASRSSNVPIELRRDGVDGAETIRLGGASSPRSGGGSSSRSGAASGGGSSSRGGGSSGAGSTPDRGGGSSRSSTTRARDDASAAPAGRPAGTVELASRRIEVERIETPGLPTDRRRVTLADFPPLPAVFGSDPGGDLQDPSLALMTAYFSQYEGDPRVPGDADRLFRLGRVQALGQQLRHAHIQERLRSKQPVGPEWLFTAALQLAGNDALLALLLCHNHCRSMGKRPGDLTHDHMALPWSRVTGDDNAVTYTYRDYSTEDLGAFSDFEVEFECGGLASNAYFINGKPSAFYLLFDPAAFGRADPNDWYHHFLSAAMGYALSSGRVSRMPYLGEASSAAVYTNALYAAVVWVQGLLEDQQATAAPDGDSFSAWSYMNALSFFEGLGYGEVREQQDSLRETQNHRAGVIRGINLNSDFDQLNQGAPPQDWLWLAPVAQGLAHSIYETIDQVKDGGVLDAASAMAARLRALTDTVLPYTHSIYDPQGQEIIAYGVAAGSNEPAVQETAVSGQMGNKIRRNDPEFANLVLSDNNAIRFKDEEATAADRIMDPKLQQRLDVLAVYVRAAFPGRFLRVTEAWDENDEHGATSLHYVGRAADITVDDRDSSKIERLGRLARYAGFDWVQVAANSSYVHVSVAP